MLELTLPKAGMFKLSIDESVGPEWLTIVTLPQLARVEFDEAVFKIVVHRTREKSAFGSAM